MIAISVWSSQRQREQARQAWQAELAHRSTLGGLLAMTPKDFERFIARLLTASGYQQVQCVGGAGDLSVDVRGVAPDGRLTVVQCKLYTPGHAVDSPAIQQFVGMAYLHHRAQLAMLVTTSDLSGPAAELARQHHVWVINGHELTAWVRKIAEVQRV